MPSALKNTSKAGKTVMGDDKLQKKKDLEFVHYVNTEQVVLSE